MPPSKLQVKDAVKKLRTIKEPPYVDKVFCARVDAIIRQLKQQRAAAQRSINPSHKAKAA